jgi:tetratricopeptide (TPR) repeat protein
MNPSRPNSRWLPLAVSVIPMVVLASATLGAAPPPSQPDPDAAVKHLQAELEQKAAELADVSRRLEVAIAKARHAKADAALQQLWLQAKQQVAQGKLQQAIASLERVIKDTRLEERKIQARWLLAYAMDAVGRKLADAATVLADSDGPFNLTLPHSRSDRLLLDLQQEAARWEAKRYAAQHELRQDEHVRGITLDKAAFQELATIFSNLDEPLWAGKCYYSLGQFEKALDGFDRYLKSAKTPLTRMEALGGKCTCYAALGRLHKVNQTLLEIKMLLPFLPGYAQTQWEGWYKAAITAAEGRFTAYRRSSGLGNASSKVPLLPTRR